MSSALLGELERVLGYPKIATRISPDEARELLDVLRLQAGIIADPDSPPLPLSPDPHDDYLICLGEAATAVIVSGDSDLLGLADQITVYTPTAFLAQLTQPDPHRGAQRWVMRWWSGRPRWWEGTTPRWWRDLRSARSGCRPRWRPWTLQHQERVRPNPT